MISGHPVKYWVAQLDDLDEGARKQALEKLAMVDGADLEPARPKLIEIWNSKSASSPMAGKILTEKLGMSPKGVSLEKVQKIIDESRAKNPE